MAYPGDVIVKGPEIPGGMPVFLGTRAAGENRRPIDQTRPLLLAAAGREPFDAATVRKHVPVDRRAALAGRRGRRAGKRIVLRRGTEKCMRNCLNERLPDFSAPGGGRAVPLKGGVAGGGWDEKKKAPTEQVGCIIDAGQDGKTEILLKRGGSG